MDAGRREIRTCLGRRHRPCAFAAERVPGVGSKAKHLKISELCKASARRALIKFL